jgi:hypothetical protein
MNWRNTWILVGLAGALFAFIFLFERHLDPSGTIPPIRPLFADFNPARATAVHIRRGNQFVLALERTNEAWRFTRPWAYPAATFPVQSLLDALSRAVPVTYISSREMISRKQTPADFGFDSAPVAVITLERGEEHRDVRFGTRTPAGDQVYVEIVGQPGVYVVSADILDNKMPRTPNDWRDTAQFHFGDEKIERCEITRSGAGFVLQLDPTNKLWRLARHRADQAQVHQLLAKIQAARVVEFVTDDSRADNETFGLQAPEFELTLVSGASMAQKVQFGRSPPNDPTRLYARIAAYTNVVLVPKAVVDLLATPYAELRDRQLAAFAPELVDIIEVRGEEKFLLRKSANGVWLAGETPADPLLVAKRLNELSQMQVTEFVKDVVTEQGFAPFGLEPAQRRYILRTVVTNAAGPTNVFVAQLDFGTNTTNRAFARRWDEDSVYAIRLLDFSHLPSAAWQLRDRRVWNFTTNQVSKFMVREGDATREVVRQPNGDWKPGTGWTYDVNPFLDQLAYQLGELNVEAWIARGESARVQFGFTTNSTQISVELRGEKPQTLTLEFGGLSPLRMQYALTTIDGQPAVFEFPWGLQVDVQSYFHLPPPPGTRRAANATPRPSNP